MPRQWYCSLSPIDVGKFKDSSPAEVLAKILSKFAVKKAKMMRASGLRPDWIDIDNTIQVEKFMSQCFDDATDAGAAAAAVKGLMVNKSPLIRSLMDDSEKSLISQILEVDDLSSEEARESALKVLGRLLGGNE